jgi:hypothetical protein
MVERSNHNHINNNNHKVEEEGRHTREVSFILLCPRDKNQHRLGLNISC